MPAKRYLAGAGQVVLVVLVGSLLLGAVLGQPVLLGYVESGSMRPTMDAGDGFVAVPTPLAGPIDEGDVVVYRAETLHGGGLTTHRVVEETPKGYVTKGDNNPFPDQAGDEPPVKRSRVVAVALQVDGHVVVIPELGTGLAALKGVLDRVQWRVASALHTELLLGRSGLLTLLGGTLLLLYVLDGVYTAKSPSRDRSRSRDRSEGMNSRRALVLLAAFVVLVATTSMALPSGVHETTVDPRPSDAAGPNDATWQTSGELSIANSAYTPAYVVIEPQTEGLRVSSAALLLAPRSVSKTTLTATGTDFDETRRAYALHYYIAVLPPSVLHALYRIHPYAPVAVIDALLGGAFYLVGAALVGTGRLRDRSRVAAIPLWRRAVRSLRGH